MSLRPGRNRWSTIFCRGLNSVVNNWNLAVGQTPTVSVTVICFNAADTICETLDSVLMQDLGPEFIELIIGDDASSDGTVQVAENWIAENGRVFNKVRLISHQENIGVSKNCSAVWQAATAEWVKTIAADDILLDDCLSTYVKFVSQNPECDVAVSKMRWFGSIDRVTPEPSQIAFFDLPAREQYKSFRFGSFNFAPTSFIRKTALESIGYADERFRNVEDLPLWLNLTFNGFRLWFCDRVTVKYRVADSTSKSSTRFVNRLFLDDLIAIHKSLRPLESDGLTYRFLRFERSIGLYSTLFISKLCGNRRNAISRLLQGAALLLRPTDLWGAIRRRIARLSGSSSAVTS